MIDLQPSLFLNRITHDVRLEIYSHMILPPFNGCLDSAGLLLSCRQLKEEMDCEATRRLRVYLQSIRKDGVYTEQGSKERRPNSVELVAPSTVLGRPIIGVKIPFLLPPVEHDWHCQKYPVRMFCSVDPTSQPESPYQKAARLRDEQHNAYSKETRDQLRAILPLHKLHLASIDIELVLDQDTAARVAEETRLEQELDTRREDTLLGTTVLGRLLDVYIRGLGFHGYCLMASWSEDWAFNVTIINMAWNFSSEELGSGPQDWIHGSRLWLWNGVLGLASCAPDRRQGTAQVQFDVGSNVQKEVKDIKRRERAERNIRGTNSSSENQEDEPDPALVQGREKLRRLGIVEGDDSELDDA